MSCCLFRQNEAGISVAANEGQVGGSQVCEVKRTCSARRLGSHCKGAHVQKPSQLSLLKHPIISVCIA